MSTNAIAPPASDSGQAPSSVGLLRTREQDFALARLDGLLQHRGAVDSPGDIAEDQPWLVHALGAAIVSYVRLPSELGVAAEADLFLRAYRGNRLEVSP